MLKNIYNFYKKISCAQRGFSLAEAVTVLGLVGASALVLLKGKYLLTSEKKMREKSFSIQVYNENLLRKGMRLLSQTVDNDGKRSAGICRLVYTNAKMPGVGQVFLDLNRGRHIFTSNTWRKISENSKPARDERCQNLQGWAQCFSYSPQQGSSGHSKKLMGAAASLEVIPVGVNPHKASGHKIFYPLDIASNHPIDVKDVSFEVISKIYLGKGDKLKIKKMTGFVWAPSVGICDSHLDDDRKSPVRLSLSGSGASDSKGNTVYNRAGFLGNERPTLKVSWRRSVAQAGITTNDGSFITTDTTKNIYGSCNEVTFRCPNLNSNERVYGVLDMILNVTYDSKKTDAIRPRFSIKKDGLTNIVRTADVSYFVGGENSFKEGEKFRVDGSLAMRISMQKNGNLGQNNEICRQICQKSSSFNSTGNQFKPTVSMYVEGEKRSYEFPTTQPLGCTACYMKSCSQFGLGTFGPMLDQPPQPQDSQFPECHLYEAKMVRNSVLLSERDKLQNSSSHRCVKAKLDERLGSLIYDTAPCHNNLPVMCYNFGTFLLARNTIGDRGGLSRVSYDQARRRCFTTAREVSGVDELNQYLGVTSTTLPTNSQGDYDFVNLAQQGVFLAPQTRSDVDQFVKWTKTNGLGASEWFWVARYNEGQGHLRYLPIFAPQLRDNERHGLYFNSEGQIVYHEFPEQLNLLTSSEENATVLAHHIKFRGLYPASKSNPANGRKLKFLCRRKGVAGDLFLSNKASHKFSDGGQACLDDNGLFLPPTTPSQWIVALNLVNNFSPKYSFPKPKNVSLENVPMVWTAYTIKGTEVANQRKVAVDASSGLIKLGTTSHYRPDFSLDPYFLMNGLGEYIDPRASISGRVQMKSELRNIAVAPNDKLIVELKDGRREKINFNNSTAEVTKSLEQIIAEFNNRAKYLRMKKSTEEGNGGENDKVKVIIKAKNIVDGQVLTIRGGGLHDKIGLVASDKGRAPASRYLYIGGARDELRFNTKAIKSRGANDGKLMKHQDIRDALDISIGITLMGYSKHDIFKLEK